MSPTTGPYREGSVVMVVVMGVLWALVVGVVVVAVIGLLGTGHGL